MNDSAKTVLIIEDGDEYLENLSRFAPGPHYLQAHGGTQAIAMLATRAVALVYLDMRFDRSPRDTLLGDHARATREQGSSEKAFRHLAQHQGLYILHALRSAGHGELPVILAYDFSLELRRFELLSKAHPSLTWMPDTASADEIRARLERLLGKL